MARNEGGTGGLRVIRGDISLSNYLFGSPAQRRLIPQLQKAGWPIFEMAGKRAARPADLEAEAAKRARSAEMQRTISAEGQAPPAQGRPRAGGRRLESRSAAVGGTAAQGLGPRQ